MSIDAVNLFQSGDFTLHSGEQSALKIECDALTSADWDTLAAMVAQRFKFAAVSWVPTGGMKFAFALQDYATNDTAHPVLLVDDVLTTGESMEATRLLLSDPSIGVVAFARGACPDWIHPIFKMW